VERLLGDALPRSLGGLGFQQQGCGALALDIPRVLLLAEERGVYRLEQGGVCNHRWVGSVVVVVDFVKENGKEYSDSDYSNRYED
jgi:hypothetical protein